MRGVAITAATETLDPEVEMEQHIHASLDPR